MTVPVTAQISYGTQNANKQADIKNNSQNNQFVFTGDANLAHVPAYYVAIYNVSDEEQKIERQWVSPGKRGKIMIIPARKEGERVSKPFIIPDIVQMATDHAGSWEMGTRGVDGRFLAQDALNPEDMRGSWRTVRPRGEAEYANEGTNLYLVGCFWTIIHRPPQPGDGPTEEEISTATARLEETYNTLIDTANVLALEGASGAKQIGHRHRRAANYFGRSFTWNMRYEKKNQCPNCAESLPATATRCYRCKHVLDWIGAIEAGTATPAEAREHGINLVQVDQMDPDAAASGDAETVAQPKPAKPVKRGRK
jgi:hypothetical protein